MAVQSTGAKVQILMQEQTGLGVVPAIPAAQLLYYSTCALARTEAQTDDNTLRGNRNPVKAIPGKQAVGGDLVANMQGYNGILLYGLLGACTSTETEVESGIFGHVLTIGDALPYYFFEVGHQRIDQYLRYRDIKVGSMSMGFTPTDQLPQTFGLMGTQEETPAVAVFDAAPSDLGYSRFDGRTLGTIEEGGAAIAKVTGIQLNFSNDLDGDQYCLGGDGVRADIPEGLVKVTGSLTARFDDLGLYNKAKLGTATSLKLAYLLGTGDGSAGNESAEYLMSELTYSPTGVPITGPRGIVESYNLSAYYATGAEASALQITLKNTQAALKLA